MELKSNDNIAVRYHDIFDYKLSKKEAIRWQYKNQKIRIKKAWPTLLVKSRLQREKYSRKKIIFAKKAAELISKIPTVLFVGVTGSLAMMNAEKKSDIDLMIITKRNSLWTTRALLYGLLLATGYKLRKPKERDEENMLCINLWLDESSLEWDMADHNLYTAHEIAQIVALVNKENVYQKFLWRNKWILDFWPNSVQILNSERETLTKFPFLDIVSDFVFHVLNLIALKMQYLYMKNKITREVITPTRAIFHPNDWGKIVINKLSS